MSAQDWVVVLGAVGVLCGAIATAMVLVIKALKTGQDAKSNPNVVGSGAAIVECLERGQAEQRRFNGALALHLGMGETLMDDQPVEHVGNGR